MGGRIDYKPVIDETRVLLNSNSEWRKRYADYASSILENTIFINNNRRRFREWSPLRLYMNTTNAKNAKRTVIFELRYLGQTVAEMKCQPDKITLSTNPTAGRNYELKNARDFDCMTTLADCAWDGTEARTFRSYFKKRLAERNRVGNSGNEEHRIESLLLSEFLKQKDKALPNIKPVTISGLRFPMPTPLSASNHEKIKYSSYNGGGIDILTRTGSGGRATNLCIIEVKDENTNREPASAAVKQAIKYTVFIRELLRSGAGADWWKLFGFGGPIPKNLTLFAACAMPYINDADTSFGGMEYGIDGDMIQLHYIYFEESENAIKRIHTSLRDNK